MFKRIMVAVDASPTGELALETAIRLAGENQGRLRIVHAVDATGVAAAGIEFPVVVDVSEGLVKAGDALLGRAENLAGAAGVAVETALLRIDVLGKRIAEAIADDANAWPADLIVVGTHGRRGMSRVFLGSVAEGVARVATRPVLLVRAT